MRVALVYTSCYPFHRAGGAEKWFYNMARGLASKGVYVEIVASADSHVSRKTIFEGVHYTLLWPMVERRRSSTFVWNFLFGLNLCRYLVKSHFDIVHSYTSMVLPYILCRGKGKVVMQLFGLEALTNPRMHGYLTNLFYELSWRFPWRRCVAQADAIAIETDRWVTKLKRLGVKYRRIIVLPQMIDVNKIRAMQKESSLTRDKLRLTDNDMVLLHVGRFLPIKGPFLAVESFALIKRMIENAKMILVGGAVWKDELITVGMVSSRIHALGLSDILIFVNVDERELYGYMSIANIFICPDLSANQLLMGLLEAMCCGLPVVSVDKDEIVKDGVNGFSVNPSPEGIAGGVAKICNLKTTELAAMKKNCIQKAMCYDISRVVGRAYAFYAELIASNRQ